MKPTCSSAVLFSAMRYPRPWFSRSREAEAANRLRFQAEDGFFKNEYQFPLSKTSRQEKPA